jgi:hypothetical protein
MANFEVTEDKVFFCLKSRVERWRDLQCGAIDSAKVPTIYGGTDIVEEIAWLAFGVTATTTLFPGTAVAALITGATLKYAIPLYVLSGVVDEFKKEVAQQEKKENIGHIQAGAMKSKFKRATDQLCMDFGKTTYCASLCKEIVKFTKSNSIAINSQGELSSFVQNIVVNAGLIETNEGVIKKRTNDGVGGLFQKIHDIYCGTYHDWGSNRLILTTPTQAVWNRDGSMTSSRQKEMSRKEQDYILTHAWQYDIVRVSDAPALIIGVDQRTGKTISDETMVSKTNSAESPNGVVKLYRPAKLDSDKIAAALRKAMHESKN